MPAGLFSGIPIRELSSSNRLTPEIQICCAPFHFFLQKLMGGHPAWQRVILSSPPMYERNASGIRTEPSAC